MSCEACADIYEVDGIEPDCQACPVPPLTPENVRIVAIHSMLKKLKGVADAGAVFNVYRVTAEDLNFLAMIEDEIKPKGDPKGENV